MSGNHVPLNGVKNTTSKSNTSSEICSLESSFLDDDGVTDPELKTRYYTTLPQEEEEEELIIYTLSISEPNDINSINNSLFLNETATSATAASATAASATAASATAASSASLHEMKYYRIGPHGMLIILDEELYDLPARHTNQFSNSVASSSKNAQISNKIKLRKLERNEFIELYRSKNISHTTSTFASLLGKPRTNIISFPETDPLNLLHEKYSADTLIDKLIKFLPNHYNFDEIPEAKRDIEYNKDKKTGKKKSAPTPTSLEKEFVEKKNNPPFQAIYGITEFLRSYIDIYHDFLHYGRKIITEIKKTFESKVLTPKYLSTVQDPLRGKLKTFYGSWMAKIDATIFTSNGRVIQPKCHQLIEELADDYIKLLHDYVGIEWMPNSKTNAFVGTYSLNSECDVVNLIKQLREDGVSEFYVESANSHIGKSLESHKMRVTMLDVGEWDAGSGYGSFKKRTVNTVIGTRTFSANPRGDKVNKRSYEVVDAPIIRLFGFIDVTVGKDYKSIHIKNDLDKNTVTINGDKDKDGYTQLSLNRVATTIKLPTIRGEGESVKLDTVPEILTNDMQKQMIASLKTWTDFIQIRTFSKLKSLPAIPKIAMIINDKCCETTARMNGLSCVLKNDGSNVTYYSYDINSRQMSPTTIAEKKSSLLRILGNIRALKEYIEKWFDVRIKTLNTIKSLAPDPVLYFSSLLFGGIYTSQKEHALNEIEKIKAFDAKLQSNNIIKQAEINELIKSFPRTVSEWMQSITNSEGIYSDFVNEIGNLRTILNTAGSRQVDQFIQYTDQLKQIIVNSLGKLITNEQQLSILVSTTIAFILFKKPMPKRYILAFDSAIEKMIKMAKGNIASQADYNDKISIMKNSSKILEELLETEYITPIWQVHESNFRNNSNSENSQGSQNIQSSQSSQSSYRAYSKPVRSFTNVYLTTPKDTLSYLSHYQTHVTHNSGKIKKDFNYGFEGIYNRAMCMLLDAKYIPDHLFVSATCAKSAIPFGKRVIVSNGNNNLTAPNNGNNNRNRSMKRSKLPSTQGGYQRYKLKTRKRSNKR